MSDIHPDPEILEFFDQLSAAISSAPELQAPQSDLPVSMRRADAVIDHVRVLRDMYMAKPDKWPFNRHVTRDSWAMILQGTKGTNVFDAFKGRVGLKAKLQAFFDS
jgi:hypothetical protein